MTGIVRLPPALAAQATSDLLERLGPPPGRALELGFAGIHARPLELAGFEVLVVEPDAVFAARATERGARVVAVPDGPFDAIVAPAGTDAPLELLRPGGRVLTVSRDGVVTDATLQ